VARGDAARHERVGTICAGWLRSAGAVQAVLFLPWWILSSMVRRSTVVFGVTAPVGYV
jgi:hypothetical protein